MRLSLAVFLIHSLTWEAREFMLFFSYIVVEIPPRSVTRESLGKLKHDLSPLIRKTKPQVLLSVNDTPTVLLILQRTTNFSYEDLSSLRRPVVLLVTFVRWSRRSANCQGQMNAHLSSPPYWASHVSIPLINWRHVWEAINFSSQHAYSMLTFRNPARHRWP